MPKLLTKSAFQGLAVLGVALFIYANTLNNGFVYDDHLQILDNPWLKNPAALKDIFTSDVWGFTEYSASDYYRPLMHALNFLIYTLFGPSRFFFHLASLVLHAGCCVLVLQIGRRMMDLPAFENVSDLRMTFPFWVALLFAVHPANVEAVAWLGSSADLLYGFFCLGSMWVYLLGAVVRPPLHRVCYVASLGMFFAATLSKETAFLFPLLILLVDWFRGLLVTQRFKQLLFYRYLGFAAVAIASLMVRLAALGTLSPVANTVKFDLWGMFQAFSWYLGRLVWPFQHNFYPELPTPARDGFLLYYGLPIALLVLFTGLLVVVRKNKLFLFAFGLILIPLLPAVANYAIGKPVAERYLYLPTMGVSLMIVWGMLRFGTGMKWRSAVFALLLVGCAGSTFARNADFKNDLTLWRDTIEKSPYSAKAMGWYATANCAAGKEEECIGRTAQAIELGLKSSNSLLDLADVLFQRGREADIDRYFKRVLELNRDDAEAFFEVGLSYDTLGATDRAISLYERAQALDPNRPLTLIYLGRAYARTGDYVRAEQLFVRALQLDPVTFAALKLEIEQLRAFREK
jgi:tetratricopeptide (TPR) repeat protein